MKRKVLFLCNHNSARSQMAEGLLRKLGGDAFEVYSAGLDVKTIHPLTVKVLDEVGVDTSSLYAKGVKEIMGRFTFDDAVIVCRRFEDDCPSISADAQRMHRWLFDDPTRVEGSDDEKLAKFREVRDAIAARITLWLAEIEEAKRPEM